MAVKTPGSSSLHRKSQGGIGSIEGLAGLSLDALTSVAYGPEAIVVVLATTSRAAISSVRPITLGIVLLLAILVFSYRQVIEAYPDGGGAYAVSKANLGQMTSLVAGASLVVDYVLTVAVSITAGVAALTSAFPGLISFSLPLCFALLLGLSVINLFGLRESAKAFLLPTLLFIAGLFAVVILGLVHPLGSATATAGAAEKVAHTAARSQAHATATVGLLLLLKAFAAGCSALTGVEAIANGTPSFREPRIKHAKRTELLLGLILGSLLLGLSQLTVSFHLVPEPHVTLLSQITQRAIGHGSMYYLIQLSTTVALALAANTSFGGLPVLGSLLARDDFLPHIFALHGERPVYRSGVVVLGVLSAVLIAFSGGNTQALIPLFAIGVFIGFTLSQSGLVKHWFTTKPKGWQWKAAINGTGAVLTAGAAIIFLTTKFVHGAYLVVIAVPLLILLFRAIHRYYAKLAVQLGIGRLPPKPSTSDQSLVLVPIIGLSNMTTYVLSRAMAYGACVKALHVYFDEKSAESFRSDWNKWSPGVQLVLLQSPEHSVVKPILRYLNSADVTSYASVTVLIPEIEPSKLRHRLLLNQRSAILASVLRRRTDAVVATLPYRLP